MENVITVIQTIKQRDYATQLDLEKAYHHQKVSENLQRYLGFKFRQKAYCYVGLPFGWNRSPLLFCRIMRSTVRAIREKFSVRVETTGRRYGLNNLIHDGAGLEDVTSQVQGNTNEGLPIPWLEVENLYDGSMHPTGQEKIIKIKIEKMVRNYDVEKDNRGEKVSTAAGRVELSEMACNGCISTYGIDQSSKNRGVEETRVEWQVEIGQENVGGFEMVGLDDQGEQSKDVRFENTNILSNDGCGDNRMGSGIGGNGEGGGIGGESWGVEWDLELEVFKLTRNSSSVNGTKINEKLLSEGDCNDHQYGQCGD
ncbi:MAG: hypothetical protein EZS28_044421, partial [Streblomastix strix]